MIINAVASQSAETNLKFISKPKWIARVIGKGGVNLAEMLLRYRSWGDIIETDEYKLDSEANQIENKLGRHLYFFRRSAVGSTGCLFQTGVVRRTSLICPEV